MTGPIDEALEILSKIEQPHAYIRNAINSLEMEMDRGERNEFHAKVRDVRNIITQNSKADEPITGRDVVLYGRLKDYFERGEKSEGGPTMLGPEQARRTPPDTSTRWRDAHGDIWYWEDVSESPTAAQGWTTAHLRTGGHWEGLGWIYGDCFPLTLVS